MKSITLIALFSKATNAAEAKGEPCGAYYPGIFPDDIISLLTSGTDEEKVLLTQGFFYDSFQDTCSDGKVCSQFQVGESMNRQTGSVSSCQTCYAPVTIDILYASLTGTAPAEYTENAAQQILDDGSVYSCWDSTGQEEFGACEFLHELAADKEYPGNYQWMTPENGYCNMACGTTYISGDSESERLECSCPIGTTYPACTFDDSASADDKAGSNHLFYSAAALVMAAAVSQ